MIGGWRSDQHPFFCAPQGMCFGNNGSMRERTLGDKSKATASNPDRGWLDLKHIATVEVTSEEIPDSHRFCFQDGKSGSSSLEMGL